MANSKKTTEKKVEKAAAPKTDAKKETPIAKTEKATENSNDTVTAKADETKSVEEKKENKDVQKNSSVLYGYECFWNGQAMAF